MFILGAKPVNKRNLKFCFYTFIHHDLSLENQTALVIKLDIYLVNAPELKTYIHQNYVSLNLIADINQQVFVFFFAHCVLFRAPWP